jgi:hypothetical protein
MRTTLSIAVPLIVLLLAVGATVSAQVPEKMNYQVMLTNDLDEPLADAAVTLVFRVYDAESGGTLKWSETHNVTTNSIGVASVVLGSVGTMHSPDFVDPMWLEIEVDSEILSPRRELLSAPYAFYAADSDALGGLEADDYVTRLELDTPGTINDGGNPVDWTKLKNVPAGFADGTDDEGAGGSGDGHSLDADDGDPVDAVYVDSLGNVGVGVTSPRNKLVVGPDDIGLSYAQFANSTTGYNQVDGLRVGVASSGGAFIAQNENSSITFLTNAQTKHRIEADGTFKFGTGAVEGVAEFYPEGGGSRQIALRTDASNGGHIGLYEDNGDQYAWLEPDRDGPGGFLEIVDGDDYAALEVDGNFEGGGSGRITMRGSGSATYFELWETGNDAVKLPINAVSDAEILDEAGGSGTSSTASLALGGFAENIAQKDIAVVAPGLVLALGTIETEVNHADAVSGASFAVSAASGSMPGGGGTLVRIPGTAGNGIWNQSLTVHGLFPVDTVGIHTFYLVAEATWGSWTVTDRSLTLVYLPTSYDFGGAIKAASAPSQELDRAPGQ